MQTCLSLLGSGDSACDIGLQGGVSRPGFIESRLGEFHLPGAGGFFFTKELLGRQIVFCYPDGGFGLLRGGLASLVIGLLHAQLRFCAITGLGDIDGLDE